MGLFDYLGGYVKKILLTAGSLGLIILAGCSQGDPSKYDVTSPCVANPSSIYLDIPCERRTPLDNIRQPAIIATS